MKKRKIIAVVIAFALSVALLAGCRDDGGDSDDGLPGTGNGSSSSSPSANSSQPGTATTPPPVAPPELTVVVYDTVGASAGIMNIRSGNGFAAHNGLMLSDRDISLTGDASNIFLSFDNSSMMKMDEKSRLEVNQISARSLSLTLLLGAISADITQLYPDDIYEIEAGNFAMVTQEASFIIEYSNSSPIFIMLSGHAHIGGTVVSAGNVARVDSGRVAVAPLVIDDSLSLFVLKEIVARKDVVIRNTHFTADDVALAESIIADYPKKPATQPAWQTAYREFLIKYHNEMHEDVDANWGFDYGYTISLLDINFDGIPELIIDKAGHWGPSRQAFFLSGSEVRQAERQHGYGQLLLVQDINTHVLRFIEIRDIFPFWWADHSGLIWEVFMIDDLLRFNQVLSVHDVPFGDDPDYAHSLLRYDEGDEYSEALTLSDSPQYFSAFSYNEQGEAISISVEEYLTLKADYLSQIKVLGDYSPGTPNYPIWHYVDSPIPDISHLINNLYTMWDYYQQTANHR